MSVKVTEKEKAAIYEFITKERKTDQEIADIMKRDIETIIRVRRNMGIGKTSRGKLLVEDTKEETAEIKEILEKDTPKNRNSERDKVVKAWILFFKDTDKYKSLEKKLDKDSLKFFTQQWAKYHVQFEDLTPTEEDMVDLLIDYKIRMEDNRNQFVEASKEEKRLRDMLGDKNHKELDLEDEQDRWIFETIQSNNNSKIAINRDFKDLTEKYEKIQRSLGSTREQREEKSKIGGDTFLNLCRELNDADKRKAVGRTNEWLRLAIEKSNKKLKSDHQYDDGVTEPMILDGADFIKDTKDENSSDIGDTGTDGLVSGPPTPPEK